MWFLGVTVHLERGRKREQEGGGGQGLRGQDLHPIKLHPSVYLMQDEQLTD